MGTVLKLCSPFSSMMQLEGPVIPSGCGEGFLLLCRGHSGARVGPGLEEEGAGKRSHWTLQRQKGCGTQFIILELTERFGANHSLEFDMQTPLRNLEYLDMAS